MYASQARAKASGSVRKVCGCTCSEGFVLVVQ